MKLDEIDWSMNRIFKILHKHWYIDDDFWMEELPKDMVKKLSSVIQIGRMVCEDDKRAEEENRIIAYFSDWGFIQRTTISKEEYEKRYCK